MTIWLLLVLILSGSRGGTPDLQVFRCASPKQTSPFSTQNISAVREDIRGKKTLSRNASEDGRSVGGPLVLSSRLQSVLPPFAVTSENVQNELCKGDSRRFLQRLAQLDLWALQMHDSSAKLPSGLLNGNVNQFGDFDQCVNVQEPAMKFSGKYCLAFLQLRLNDPAKSSARALELLQSHFVFRSELTDPGHRVPRFSSISWGLCVPSSCTSEDVRGHLKDIVERYSKGTGFDVDVRVDSEMCQEKKPFKVSPAFGIVSCLVLCLVMVAAAATVNDVVWPKEKTSPQTSFRCVLDCFSLRRNGKALLDVTKCADDIECLHGIRMINAVMLVLSHKSMALFFVPYANRTSMVERLNQQWTIIARIASLYTDSFIMMSGLLSSYSVVKTLQKKGSVSLKYEYAGRLIRIIPPMAVIILLCTFILPELGSGPQWNLTVSHHAGKCRQSWWNNFLFIHNYLGFENMCLTHTHHLGIDTQLFLLSPFLAYCLHKWPNYGFGALVALSTASTVARYQVTADRNLSFFIYPGISVGQMFDTANFSYIIPFHRLTAYTVGIFLGYVLRLQGRDYRLKPHLLALGWTVTFSFLSYVLTKATEMNRPEYVYDSREAAMYAALAPLAWCLFVGWVVFVCYTGRGGIVGRVLSWKYWVIGTRLSYAVYLTQFPIFFFGVGLQKYPQQYSFLLLVNVWEYLSVVAASVALTLFCDMPFGNLKKLMLPK